jgi:hypothetical protein
MGDDFISSYVSYMGETEPPYIYHRWSAIAAVGAMLGRNYYFQHGHFRVFPNLYCMFLGEAGSRKSTAIKLARKFVLAAGYEFLGADKTSKEKFLLDLEGAPEEDTWSPGGSSRRKSTDRITEENLWGKQTSEETEPREVFVMADEFNEFSGTGNLEFYTTLGNLWDWDDESKPFTQRLKNSRSVSIWQPTINILGGNTPENFAKAFPPDIIGQGFLSRMIIIGGWKSGRKYTFPPVPAAEKTEHLVQSLASIRTTIKSQASVTEEALGILDAIYHGWEELDDVRFRSYSNRRFTQLLKLCLIVSASRGNYTITDEAVITANTYLAAAESGMPRALGEFGKSKNSDVTNKIMDVLASAKKPVTMKELWTHVHLDLDKPGALADIMSGLGLAGKVQNVANRGWLAKKLPGKAPEFVAWELLTEEERTVI